MKVWTDSLTADQRNDWNVGAANTPIQQYNGRHFFILGDSLFVLVNLPRLTAGLPIAKLAIPPQALDESDIFNVTCQAPNLLSFNWSTGHFDPTYSGSAIIVHQLDHSPIKSSYQERYGQFAQAVIGSPTTPPTSPSTITFPQPVAAGDWCWFGFVMTDDRTGGSTKYLQQVQAS